MYNNIKDELLIMMNLYTLMPPNMNQSSIGQNVEPIQNSDLCSNFEFFFEQNNKINKLGKWRFFAGLTVAVGPDKWHSSLRSLPAPFGSRWLFVPDYLVFEGRFCWSKRVRGYGIG